MTSQKNFNKRLYLIKKFGRPTNKTTSKCRWKFICITLANHLEKLTLTQTRTKGNKYGISKPNVKGCAEYENLILYRMAASFPCGTQHLAGRQWQMDWRTCRWIRHQPSLDAQHQAHCICWMGRQAGLLNRGHVRNWHRHPCGNHSLLNTNTNTI